MTTCSTDIIATLVQKHIANGDASQLQDIVTVQKQRVGFIAKHFSLTKIIRAYG
jgi:hypothetical protein